MSKLFVCDVAGCPDYLFGTWFPAKSLGRHKRFAKSSLSVFHFAHPLQSFPRLLLTHTPNPFSHSRSRYHRQKYVEPAAASEQLDQEESNEHGEAE